MSQFSLTQILALNKMENDSFVSNVSSTNVVRYKFTEFIRINDINLLFAQFMVKTEPNTLPLSKLKFLLQKLDINIVIDFKECSITFLHQINNEEHKTNGIPKQTSFSLNNSPKLRRIDNFFDIEVTTLEHGLRSLPKIIEGLQVIGLNEKAQELIEFKEKWDIIGKDLNKTFSDKIQEKILLQKLNDEGKAEFILDIFNKIKNYLTIYIFPKFL